MKKSKFILCALLLAVLLLLNCTTVKSIVAEIPKSGGTDNVEDIIIPAVKKPTLLLWELKTEKAVIYLFGSIHLATKEIYPLNEAVYKAFDKSDNLVVEFDLVNSDQTELQNLIYQTAFFDKNDSILNYASTEMVDQLTTLLAGYNLKLENVTSFKPWFIEMMISVTELQAKGFDPELGIDKHFLQKAVPANKTILELESAKEQIDIFNEMTIETQLASLQSSITELVSVTDILKQLIEYWQTGNAEELSKLLFATYNDTPEYQSLFEKLYKNRNIKWAAKIEQMIADGGTYFIIAGAAHFVGKDSVIALLKEKGYTVEQQ